MRTSRMRSERHRRLAAARVRRCGARFVAAVILASAAAIPAHAQAPSVGTVYAVRKPITDTVTYVGRIEAVNRVEISARVQGYLEAVLFKEGDVVKKGAPLYRIEKGLFQAAVAAGARRARAQQGGQDPHRDPIAPRRTAVVAKLRHRPSTRDQARATDEENKAAILSNQANLETAKINLGYTDIISPIAGKIGRTNITKGNVVGPNSGALTLIVSQDPMYVTLSGEPARRCCRRRPPITAPTSKDIKVKVRFSDGTTYDQVGAINFVDVSVDRMTDTVLVRAIMPNPAGILIDGQLVRVALEGGQAGREGGRAAGGADRRSAGHLCVRRSKTARPSSSGSSSAAKTEPNIVVDGGLKGGEQVIVEGMQSVRPGQPVQASPLPASLSRS